MALRTLQKKQALKLFKHLETEAAKRQDQELAQLDKLLFSPDSLSEDAKEMLQKNRQLTMVLMNTAQAAQGFILAQRSPEIPLELLQPVIDQAIESSYQQVIGLKDLPSSPELKRSFNIVTSQWKAMFDQLLANAGDRSREA